MKLLHEHPALASIPPPTQDLAEIAAIRAGNLAMAFYDHMLGHATPECARVQAQMYLRRKVPDMSPEDARQVLEGALTRRVQGLAA